MKTAIIGVGLIGSSFALSLRDNKLCSEIIGVDQSKQNREKALELGIIDSVATLEEALEQAKLIVVSVPVDAIPILSVKLLNKVKPTQIIMDMGSTKQELCETISLHPNRARFVATHPMWGTENSGPEAAVKGAFKGRAAVICNRDESDDDALRAVEHIYQTIGMPIKYMDAEEHDVHTAYVSHVSHISSFALALTVLEKERETSHIFDLAGGGFESTARLAKSSYSMWLPIFLQNKHNVLDVLREYIHQLQVFKKMLERDDAEGLQLAMQKANTIRDILDKKSNIGMAKAGSLQQAV